MIKRAAGLVLQGYFRIEAFQRGSPSRGLPAGAVKRSTPLPGMCVPVELARATVSLAAAQPKPGRAQLASRSAAVSSLRRRDASAAQPRPASPQVQAASLQPGRARLVGGGRPLSAPVRRPLEEFFQADLSTVRIHEGPAANAIGAAAFTLGENIYFAPGRFAPQTQAGLQLLGHELSHVVQQRQGLVVNPFSAGIAVVQDPTLEAEAERMGQLLATTASSRAGRSVGQAKRAGGLAARTGPSIPMARTRSPGAALLGRAARPAMGVGRGLAGRALQRSQVVAPVTKNNSVEVYQNEVIVTTTTKTRSVLGTTGLGPCVALVLVGNDCAALAHLDGNPMIRTLRRVIAYMRKTGKQVEMTGQIYGCSDGLVRHRERAESLLKSLGVTVLKHVVHDTPDDYGQITGNLNLAVSAAGVVTLDITNSKLGSRTNVHKHESDPKRYRNKVIGEKPLAWTLLDDSTCTWNGDAFDSAIVTTGKPPIDIDIEELADTTEYLSEVKTMNATGYAKKTFASEQKGAPRVQIAFTE